MMKANLQMEMTTWAMMWSFHERRGDPQYGEENGVEQYDETGA